MASFKYDNVYLKIVGLIDLPEEMKDYKYHKTSQDGKTTEFYISSEYNNLK